MPRRAWLNQRLRGPCKLKTWYERLPERLEEDKTLVASNPSYAKLRLERDGASGGLYWIGPITVRSKSRIPDTVVLKILYTDDYPDSLPLVSDVEGRFPADLKRHITDWGFCLLLALKKELDLRTRDNIIDFLDQVVLFVHRQLIFEATGSWPGPEESHGFEAVLKFRYESLYGSDDPEARSRLISVIVGMSKVGRNESCPCRLPTKFKRCHLAYVAQLRTDILANPQWERAVARIREALKHQS